MIRSDDVFQALSKPNVETLPGKKQTTSKMELKATTAMQRNSGFLYIHMSIYVFYAFYTYVRSKCSELNKVTIEMM